MICSDCPRLCAARRNENAGDGVCGMGTLPVVARAGVHLWEEPCISGTHGSGTVFFSGCALGCVFCQNHTISAQHFGKQISVERLRAIYGELIAQGVHNINLVTPSHFVRAVAQSLCTPFPVPVVYNCGGYESIDALRLLEGKISIYIPDFKYTDAAHAARYAHAPDYPEVARAAIREMVRQTGPYRLDENGILQSGVLIRHLILPGMVESALDVIDWIADTFAPGMVLLSLMAQYVPLGSAAQMPEINRTLREAEYERVVEYLRFSSVEEGYLQELSSAKEQYIPNFDLQGVTSNSLDL